MKFLFIEAGFDIPAIVFRAQAALVFEVTAEDKGVVVAREAGNFTDGKVGGN